MGIDDPLSKEYDKKLRELKNTVVGRINKSQVPWMEALQDFLNSSHEVRSNVLDELPEPRKRDFLSAITMLAQLGLAVAMQDKMKREVAETN